jgi:hypothetical protein
VPCVQNSTRAVIWTKFVGASQVEECRQSGTGSVKPAADRRYPCPAHCSRILVAKSQRANQKQRFLLAPWKRREGRTKLIKLDSAVLVRHRFQGGDATTVNILDLISSFATLRKKKISKYCTQPGAQVCAGLEGLDIGYCAHQGLLDQIVGSINIAAQRNGKRTQSRHRR